VYEQEGVAAARTGDELFDIEANVDISFLVSVDPQRGHGTPVSSPMRRISE
jgi:hypothetical protein